MPLGFTKAHNKITPRAKKWAWLWAKGSPQNLGFPFNISATPKVSDFKFGPKVGFAMLHHKITPRGKMTLS